MGQIAFNWPALAVILSFGSSLAFVIYKTGQVTARVEAIEQWRLRVRNDMHEVSEAVQGLTAEISKLKTLIEERTERRSGIVREQQ